MLKRGNLIKADDAELVSIHEINPIYVTFSVPEARLPEIRRQMKSSKLHVTAIIQDAYGFDFLLAALVGLVVIGRRSAYWFWLGGSLALLLLALGPVLQPHTVQLPFAWLSQSS